MLVLRAGSGAANNLIRSLAAGESPPVVVGGHSDRFVLKKSPAARNYIVPEAPAAFVEALRKIIARESIDLVIATSDADVHRLSSVRDEIPGRTFLPHHDTIDLCQDKLMLTQRLRDNDLPAPLTHHVETLDSVEAIFERLAPREKLWCRVRSGTGSFGAIPVTTPEQARSWISYWEDMRGVPPGSFTLSEYLPGRDFCVQSLWKDGRLILTKMAERITYIDSGSPSGVSSTPALAETAFEPHIIETCTKAVASVDSHASGVFFLDIKESADGRPCITEINAGRFAAITNIHDLTGRHNMAQTFVDLAVGESSDDLVEATDFAKEHYLVRSIDTVPVVMNGEELFDGIRHWDD